MKKLFTTLILLLAVTINLSAQNVYISPETGHLIAAVTYDREVGFQNGFSALWRHDQLGLNIVVADDANLTTGGEIANPAGNLNIVNGKLTLTGGQSGDCFMVVSLPKGYRFTSYDITLDNNMNGHTYSSSFTTGNLSKIFYETNEKFDYNSPNAQTKEMSGTNDNTGYTINRQASDMGNRLYFRLHKNTTTNNYYGVSIRSFVIHFSADAPFEQPLQMLPFSTAVGVAKSSFMVGKPELGTIKSNTKNGRVYYYSYNYKNVDDLEADNLLYQANAVADGKASDDANTITKRTITRTINKGTSDGIAQPWFALAKGSDEEDNTYFVETPVTLTSATGHTFPTGYRITGAKLDFALGQPSDNGYVIGVNRHGEITYLQADGTMSSSDPETGWMYNSSSRRFTLKGRTIYVARSFWGGYYYLTTSYSLGSTSTFYVDEKNRIYTNIGGNKQYIHEGNVSGQAAVLNSDENYAAQLMQYSGFTPSANGFTVEVYDKTGKTVTQTATINSSNNSQSIDLSGFNNDAIKFKVSGLSDNSQALVRVTLTMEHLNPYIHTLDVVGKDANGDNELTQKFTADNFSVRGGHFIFNVPEGTSGHTWNFEFDNLTSNYTDKTYKPEGSTYEGATSGNARIAFVESEYFKANEDLYAESYNPDYTPVSNKLQVKTVGTVPFRFNNADQLSNDNESEFESQLEEYPFSVAKYKENSGYTDKDGNVIQGDFQQLQLKAGEENIAYIIVADETRYNIAPTTATQHRYYAHYAMDIELQEREYELKIEPVKIYDKTFFTDDDGNEVEKSMWGVNISTTESNGYAHLSNIVEKLVEICSNKQYSGLDTCSQILYVDMSSLQSIVIPSTGGRTNILYQFRELMAPNCLIYLPNNTADKVDNFAYKSTSESSFNANSNIIITDKKPFFAPYNINVPSGSYAKYTREITHTMSGKAQLTTIVLPFKFTVSAENGTHYNNNASDLAGDGKTFTVCKLSQNDAISTDKGSPFKEFKNDIYKYDEYVHFDVHKPSSGKTEAYEPYLIYIESSQQLGGNDNFTVLEYGADVIATETETTITGSTSTKLGKIKITDENNKSTGVLKGNSFTLTPTASMAGCVLNKDAEPCLYFAGDRFRSSWSMTTYSKVYCFPFRTWFAYKGNTANAKDNYYGVAFGFSGETTGIEDIEADKAAKAGTYKFTRNGKLYIHTDNGVYTVEGTKINL